MKNKVVMFYDKIKRDNLWYVNRFYSVYLNEYTGIDFGFEEISM